jgi:hypothetical protein
MRIQVFRAVNIKIMVFWNVTLYSLVERVQHFEAQVPSNWDTCIHITILQKTRTPMFPNVPPHPESAVCAKKGYTTDPLHSNKPNNLVFYIQS